MNLELLDVQAGFRKVRGTRDQIVNVSWIVEKAREFQKNIYFCFISCGNYCEEVGTIISKLPMTKQPLDQKFLKRWEYQTTWPASWEICMLVKKQQLEVDMEQQTGSK